MTIIKNNATQFKKQNRGIWLTLLRRGVQLKSLTPLIGGTTAPIFNTQFMEKKKVTTLENMSGIIKFNTRRIGNTTRLIDRAIQIIFNGYICIVLDHHEYGGNRQANINLFNLIIKRLDSEHKYLLQNNLIKVNPNRLEIYLVDLKQEN